MRTEQVPEVEVRFLEPEEWPRLASMFETQNAPMPDPHWSKVLVAEVADEIVGVICIQLVVHAEPIMVKREWQGTRVARDLSAAADGYLAATGCAGAYTQPLREGAKRLARAMGYTECEAPLFVKIYDERYRRLVPVAEED